MITKQPPLRQYCAADIAKYLTTITTLPIVNEFKLLNIKESLLNSYLILIAKYFSTSVNLRLVVIDGTGANPTFVREYQFLKCALECIKRNS